MTCGLGLSAKGLFVIQFSAEIDMWSRFIYKRITCHAVQC